MHAQGSFEVTMNPEPPLFERGGLTVARATFDKRFSGPLQATSVVWFTSVRTPDPASAAYVAIERIDGTLDGRVGSFVVTHLATSTGDGRSLEIAIVAGSGTDALAGITGRMTIHVEGGRHTYEIDYTLP
jgi:hypothetical protein